MMILVAYLAHLVHNHTVLKTKSTGFGSPNCKRRTNRHHGGIFSSTAFVRLYGRAIAGRLRPAGSFCAGLPTSLSARPPHLEVGSGFISQKEAAMAMSTHVRASFPTTVSTAAHAARMWFIPRTTSMTLAEWRDYFRDLHLAGIRCDDWQERQQRTAAWNAGFNTGVAQMIAGGASHE